MDISLLFNMTIIILQHAIGQPRCDAKQFKSYLFTKETQQSTHEPFIQCLSIKIKLEFVVFVIKQNQSN